MTRQINTAYLYGWHPGEHTDFRGEANYVFEPGDIEQVEITERVSDLKDTARITVFNPDGKYTDDNAEGMLTPQESVFNEERQRIGYDGTFGSGEYGRDFYQPLYGDPQTGEIELLRHGDRVEYYTAGGGKQEYGSDVYGDGLYSPGLGLDWTGVVRNYKVTSDGRDIYDVDFDAEDFAYAVMSMRRITNSWVDEDILTGPGGNGGIINTILGDTCPELDLSQLPTLPASTSISLDDENVLEAVSELANRAGALMYSDADRIYFQRPEEIQTAFRLETDDYKTYDYSSNDDELFNRVRVVGGQDHGVHSEQLTQDAWTTATRNNRVTQRITIRKSEVDRIELWTDPTISQSEEAITVRLQAGDENGPIEPSNTRSDIARKKLSYDFLAEDGFTTFILPEHDLPTSEPWLIVETDGDAGQDIGIRQSDGALTMRTHYPYPVIVNRNATGSQSEYRLREETLNDETATSLSAARDKGISYLNRNDEPDIEITFEADSRRMHLLSPGSVIRIDLPQVNVSGRYVCIERTRTWTGHLEDATLTFRNLRSL